MLFSPMQQIPSITNLWSVDVLVRAVMGRTQRMATARLSEAQRQAIYNRLESAEHTVRMDCEAAGMDPRTDIEHLRSCRDAIAKTDDVDEARRMLDIALYLVGALNLNKTK
jgi:hypothetical protein